MRPFRFFFAVSFGILLFFFFAKFVIGAFLMAAVLSLLFFFARKIKYLFQRMSWEDEGYYRDRFRNYSEQIKWQGEPLSDFRKGRQEIWNDYRTIKIQ